MKHIIIAVILIISNVFLGIAKPMKSQAEIYFAGGCFWGTEHFLKQIRGVESTQVGYANSTVANPSYEQVCSGKTNAARWRVRPSDCKGCVRRPYTVGAPHRPCVIAKIVLSFISNCFNVYFPAAKLLVDSTAGNTPIL